MANAKSAEQKPVTYRVVWPNGDKRLGGLTEAEAYADIEAYEKRNGNAPGIDHGFGMGSGLRVEQEI